ncbi:MAG: phosphoribosylaminoimidazolecarboxamide formyltransferase [Candidatus Ornithospirochaeta sp.]
MTVKEYFSGKKYPGRIIIAGRNKNGELVTAYAIEGRSENSRNRVFRLKDGLLETRPFDESKVEDPSLIIYRAKAVFQDKVILTNGDQTDTILNAFNEGRDLPSALATRTYEPDAPNFTPRISLVADKEGYSLSILKKNGDKCERTIWNYIPQNGIAHTIHTYDDDANPLPSFSSSPVILTLPETYDEFRNTLWSSLDKDNRISLYISWGDKEEVINAREGGIKETITLKYGLNPNQKNASISTEGHLPLRVLNGRPGYINFLDALNGWQLVKELKKATSLPAAASFKHVSPAGAAVAVPLSEEEKKMFFVSPKAKLSPLSTAYIRARGADRMSSFGDFIALSDVCDKETARVISREVSDGVIAPGYSEEALEILKAKKNGSYTIIEMDEEYECRTGDTRTVCGITFTQDRNDFTVTDKVFSEIVSERKDFSPEARRDMTVALIALKYTQSNSVVYAKNGQTIGVGAGQQSRIHCTRLAGEKADKWWLRQCPKVLDLPFRDGITRNDKDNIIEQYLSDDSEIDVVRNWHDYFLTPVAKLGKEEKKEWMKKMEGVSLSSDAFFPFRDNIDRAAKSGVEYITEPGGSLRDSDVVKAADEHNMTLFFTHSRLFHH